MKRRRTRMLIVVITASIIISFFMHWDELEKGFRDGLNEGSRHSTVR
jgi:hypothetical protein